jgi:hypothetical protein
VVAILRPSIWRLNYVHSNQLTAHQLSAQEERAYSASSLLLGASAVEYHPALNPVSKHCTVAKQLIHGIVSPD